MAVLDAFIGSPQSKMSGVAIFVAVIALFIALLFSNPNIAILQKVGIAFIFLLISIPILLYNLFQLTCLVTGSGVNWWCGFYAWIITAITVLFSIFIIGVVIYVMIANKPLPPPQEEES